MKTVSSFPLVNLVSCSSSFCIRQCKPGPNPSRTHEDICQTMPCCCWLTVIHNTSCVANCEISAAMYVRCRSLYESNEAVVSVSCVQLDTAPVLIRGNRRQLVYADTPHCLIWLIYCTMWSVSTSAVCVVRMPSIYWRRRRRKSMSGVHVVQERLTGLCVG